MKNFKILIIEDEEFFAENLKLHLLKHGYNIVGMFDTAEEALEQIDTLAPTLVLMDIVLKGAMDGIEAAQKIHDNNQIPVIFITANANKDFLSRAKVTEPHAYILKPLNECQLLLSIELTIYKYAAERKLLKSRDNLDTAQRIARIGNWNWDVTNNSLEWSDEIYRIFELDKADFNASFEGFMAAVHPDDRSSVQGAVDAAVHKWQSYNIEHRIITPDGKCKIVHQEGDVKHNEHGQATFMIGTIQDITTKREKEAELSIYASVFENASEGVMITDSNNIITMANDAYCNFTGYQRDEIIGRNPIVIQPGYHDKNFYKGIWNSIIKTGKWQGEIWDKRKNGEAYQKWMSVTAIKSHNGIVSHHVGIFTDISELKKKEAQLHQLAYYDTLTGLANRTHFDDRLKQEIAIAKRKKQHLAILYIDLDKFKKVNDKFGHNAGDELLQQSANRMGESVRETDILFRMGGDEFIGILTSIGNTENAAAVAQKIINSLSQSFSIDGNHIEIGCSIGISIFPDDGDTAAQLVKHADRAMYSSKESGGGTMSMAVHNSEKR